MAHFRDGPVRSLLTSSTRPPSFLIRKTLSWANGAPHSTCVSCPTGRGSLRVNNPSMLCVDRLATETP